MFTILRFLLLGMALLLGLQHFAMAQLLVGNAGGGSGYVNAYTLDGTPIALPLAHVQVGYLEGIAVYGNHLYTADLDSGTIGDYNVSTGQPFNTSYITFPSGPSYGIGAANGILYVTHNGTLYAFDITGPPVALWTVSGFYDGLTITGGHVFAINGSVSNGGIAEINALTGAVESPHLVTGLYDTFNITTDGTYLYTSSYAGGTISKFTLSGQIVNANLVTGIPDGANGLAVTGGNLYVADIFDVLEYNAATGAYIRTITGGIDQALSVAIVPEPRAIAFVLVGLVLAGGLKIFSNRSRSVLNPSENFPKGSSFSTWERG
jgi:hypothetical protein